MIGFIEKIIFINIDKKSIKTYRNCTEERDFMETRKEEGEQLYIQFKERYTKKIESLTNELKRIETDKNTDEIVSLESCHGDFEEFLKQHHIRDIERRLYVEQQKLKYVRPNTIEDVRYRQRQEKEFQKELLKVIPQNLLLRFHASPIYSSEAIIKQKRIVPSYDIFGIKTSADVEGKISVTRADNIHMHTLPRYSDLFEYKECLPAGCIFALFPLEETELDDEKWFMNKVDFSEHPEQLYRIITTPENISIVQQWCLESGLDVSYVCDYDNFVKILENDVAKNRFTNKDGRQCVTNMEHPLNENQPRAYYEMLDAAKSNPKHRISTLNRITQIFKNMIKGKSVKKENEQALEE